MAKVIRNGWKQWTDEELEYLRAFARMKLTKDVIGLKLGRTPAAVAQRAWQERIALPGRRTKRRPSAADADQAPPSGGEARHD